jgi:hypothetical protein
MMPSVRRLPLPQRDENRAQISGRLKPGVKP